MELGRRKIIDAIIIILDLVPKWPDKNGRTKILGEGHIGQFLALEHFVILEKEDSLLGKICKQIVF